LQLLLERLPQGARVLDAGCGSGYPVTQLLAESFLVTGLDFAKEQIRRAKKRAPTSTFVCGDITSLPFRDSSFDAVVSYYAIIHVPRNEHRELILNLHRILRPDGLALLCMGSGELPSDTGDWFGTKMFWSHYDSETNLRIMRDSQFTILRSEIVDDPISQGSSHLFVLGQKDRPQSVSGMI
jgi:ubiquinone/menaquinone biosynthesis C-methylase UbiE